MKSTFEEQLKVMGYGNQMVQTIDNTTRQSTPSLNQYAHDTIKSYRSAANVADFKVIGTSYGKATYVNIALL